MNFSFAICFSKFDRTNFGLSSLEREKDEKDKKKSLKWLTKMVEVFC